MAGNLEAPLRIHAGQAGHGRVLKSEPQVGAFRRSLLRLASLRLTLLLIALLAIGTTVALQVESARTWPIVVPLVLFAANLLAAVATNGVFRRQTALLIFHLSLIALLLLIAAGRLTYLKGHAGVTQDAEFDGELAIDERGPWHAGKLDQVHFINRGFSIDYAPGLQRGPTRNAIDWQTPDGQWKRAIVGDQEPLEVHGYRFYTSFNKGFAPSFQWLPTGDAPAYGSVQLPSYPLNEYSQAIEWTPPGSQAKVWVMLDIDEVVIDPESHSGFRLPKAYSLVVRLGEERHTLQPGDGIDLPEGRLVFDGLRSWMGYKVFYDWTLPWLLAACALAAVSLAAHFWQKFAARPWDA